MQRTAEPAPGTDGGELGAGTSATLLGLRGGGRPLSTSERAFFEPRFGADFSRVRVHTDGRADQAARSIHARAFTLGSHVGFRSGQYNPNAPAGRRLLAHELTHVLQQDHGVQRASSLVQRQGEETPVFGPAPPPTVPRPRDIDFCVLLPGLCRPGPTSEELFRQVPPPPCTTDGLREFFERSSLLRVLPSGLRDQAVSGLVRADEAIVGAIVGQVEMDPEYRQALSSALRRLLRLIKRGCPPKTPPTPQREIPGLEPRPFPKAPGERIFMLPPIRF